MGLGRASNFRCHRSSCAGEAPAEEGITRHRTRGQRCLGGEPRGETPGLLPQRAARARARHARAEEPRPLSRPPPQRRPLLRRRDAPRRRCAYRLAHSLGRLLGVSPQRQRVADGVERVPQRASHAAGHHDQHRFAGPAAVPPRDHRRGRRSLARQARPLHVTAAKPVADDSDSSARLVARGATGWAPRRPRRRARRRPLCPKLDVDRGLDDSCVASLDCRQLPSAERGGRNGALTPPANFLSEHCARMSSPVRPLRRGAQSGPETRKLRAGGPPPACAISLTQPARDPSSVPQLRCSVTPL